MSKHRYLTKSGYKIGLSCPTKLYYTGKNEYPDNKMNDPFMQALADGGHQVGELAKYYFPSGHDIATLEHDEAASQTEELLKQDEVIIYEAAIRHENLFIRIDVLVKKNDHFDLIEVKAKSYDSATEPGFIGKQGGVNSKWKEYLHDVSFQNHVLSKAYPTASIDSYLMLADKRVKCGTDGLNQKISIKRDKKNRKGVSVSSSLTEDDLKTKILIQVPVNEAVHIIQNEETFEDNIQIFSDNYKNDIKIESAIGSKCKKCEFIPTNEEESSGLKSGFKECWTQQLNWKEGDFNDHTVLDIWDFRKTDEFIEKNKIKLKDIVIDDIEIKEDKKPGLSRTQRQWKQIEMGKENNGEVYIDIDGLKAEMDSWTYPLHFIDFETSSVALPFHQGRRPYEGIAFQFSHHIVYENGDIEHANEYINTNRGEFPNFEFVRALKKAVGNDNGTIFRYADHENTYLNHIYKQINEQPSAIDDAEELCGFIKSITHSSNSADEKWTGSRDMVDMLQLVKRYYYSPETNGSNSIKAILPAILNSSIFLQEKYKSPIYGAAGRIKSLNFLDWTWVKYENDLIVDPYKLLPKLFKDVSDKDYVLLTEEDDLKNGGAAMAAYARMQHEDISDYEVKELKKGLLKYCELDTFAMVMIYEGWNNVV